MILYILYTRKSIIYILYKKYDTNLLHVSVISFQNEDVNIVLKLRR